MQLRARLERSAESCTVSYSKAFERYPLWKPMPSTDTELLCLEQSVRTARELFVRIIPGVRDPAFLRHAKDIWSEAQQALRRYEILKAARRSSRAMPPAAS